MFQFTPSTPTHTIFFSTPIQQASVCTAGGAHFQLKGTSSWPDTCQPTSLLQHSSGIHWIIGDNLKHIFVLAFYPPSSFSHISLLPGPPTNSDIPTNSQTLPLLVDLKCMCRMDLLKDCNSRSNIGENTWNTLITMWSIRRNLNRLNSILLGDFYTALGSETMILNWNSGKQQSWTSKIWNIGVTKLDACELARSAHITTQAIAWHSFSACCLQEEREKPSIVCTIAYCEDLSSP